MVHIYLPMDNAHEPDTLPFVQWLKVWNPDVQFVVSRSNLETREMTHFLWDEQTVLETNIWGISEPKAGIIVDESAIDAVLVPLLVVDRFGNRVGYGKGFYDRFLAKCREGINTVGLSYFEPVDVIDDVDAWDIRLKSCVTPYGAYQFQ